MRTGRVENWQEIDWFGQTRLCGNVYECPSFEEGELFVSSEIVETNE